MNNQDREAIDSVFTRLQQVESQGAPRDNEAEALIQSRLQSQPGSAYYLAQTVMVQEQALKAAQQKIAELEQRSSPAPTASSTPDTGFGRSASAPGATNAPLGSGFGASPANAQAPQTPGAGLSGAGFGRNAGGGGGFLAGALQTAMGVAGGMMLGNMLGGLFGGNEAKAAPPAEPAAEPAAADAPADDTAQDDFGGDDMGGFDEF